MTTTGDTGTRTATTSTDAIQLLITDHKQVKPLLKSYKQLVHAEGG